MCIQLELMELNTSVQQKNAYWLVMKVTERRVQLGDPFCLDEEGVCMCLYTKSSKYEVDIIFTIFVFTIQAPNV